MTILEILLIGVGLSMDAVAVSMTDGMVYKGLSKVKLAAIPLFFGAFQGLMPLAGFFAGGFFAEIITKRAGIIILLILGVIGAKMIKEGVDRGRKERNAGSGAEGGPVTEAEHKKNLSFGILLMQSVATSIDAFAVGIGFSAASVDILYAVILIAATTAALSGAALAVGKNFGNVLGSKAEILGGVILIAIGVKALF